MAEWMETARLAGRMLAQVDTARALAATFRETDPQHAGMLVIAAFAVEVAARAAGRKARASYSRVAEA